MAPLGPGYNRSPVKAANIDESSDASSYKRKRTFGQRIRESDNIKKLHPNKIPVIVERYSNEKHLPNLGQSKFLVPTSLTVGELNMIIRRRLELNHSQTLFLLVNGRNIPGNTATLSELYEKEGDGDGFLYILFASQDVFG